ncbi:hypothetical protein KM043_017259 [Ampulex compressa]|nr:hypothetical protein KM043_017259 [Ampulex compressa]
MNYTEAGSKAENRTLSFYGSDPRITDDVRGSAPKGGGASPRGRFLKRLATLPIRDTGASRWTLDFCPRRADGSIRNADRALRTAGVSRRSWGRGRAEPRKKRVGAGAKEEDEKKKKNKDKKRRKKKKKKKKKKNRKKKETKKKKKKKRRERR